MVTALLTDNSIDMFLECIANGKKYETKISVSEMSESRVFFQSIFADTAAENAAVGQPIHTCPLSPTMSEN